MSYFLSGLGLVTFPALRVSIFPFSFRTEGLHIFETKKDAIDLLKGIFHTLQFF